MNVLKIKILDNNDSFLREVYTEVQDKIFKHDGDVGFDLFHPMFEELNRGISYKLKTGIACELVRRHKSESNEIPDLEESLPYMIVPRSSISKTPLRLCNSIGIIDAGYRGELLAFVDCHADRYCIGKGDRLFQLVLPNMERINKVELVDELSETTRGSGGFGSTGK